MCANNRIMDHTHTTRTEEEEIRRYKEELQKMEEAWSKDDFTDWEDYEFRKYGFDDIIYDRLYEQHQRNLKRIRKKQNKQQKKGPSQATLWDFISTKVE